MSRVISIFITKSEQDQFEHKPRERKAISVSETIHDMFPKIFNAQRALTCGGKFFLDVCEMKCDEMCFRPTLRRWHEANTKITQASDSIGILNTIPTLQKGTPSFYLKRVIY